MVRFDRLVLEHRFLGLPSPCSFLITRALSLVGYRTTACALLAPSLRFQALRVARSAHGIGALGVVLVALGCGGKTVSVLESTDGAGASEAGANGTGTGGDVGGRACWAPENCGQGLICHPDGQCLPAPASCGLPTCSDSPEGTCGCAWTCSDQTEYRTDCLVTDSGLVACHCAMDGQEFPWTCVVEEPKADACGLGAVCCSFPSAANTPWG